jgi:serine O-acetyltransferase
MSGAYPKNQWVRNGKIADFYLNLLRKKNKFSKIFGALIGCDIACKLPDRLFLPHPNGVIVGGESILENDVVLNHQVTLGGKDPHYQGGTLKNEYPVLRQGVYVGAGAKILGNCTVGEWAIIGANAVVTRDVPSYATVVGFNKVIERRIDVIPTARGESRAQ